MSLERALTVLIVVVIVIVLLRAVGAI